MGAFLKGTIGQLTADRHWGVDDFAPIPHMVPSLDTSTVDQQSAESYACGCLHTLRADRWKRGKPIRWCIPENVSLTDICGSEEGAAEKKNKDNAEADVLGKLISALSSHWLVSFSIEGHSEVTALDVQQWAARLGSSAPAMAPAAPWSSIRIANLSGCSLGDAGVQALLSTVFPTSTAASASSEKGPSDAMSAPHRAVLPLLESLILDGVGLTDRGAVWVTSYLSEVAWCMEDARPDNTRDDASFSSSKRSLLHTLSLQRNTLGAVGVLTLLHTSLVNPFSTGGLRSHIVETVDLSWNSLTSVSCGCDGGEEHSSAARRKLLIALGAGMVQSISERQRLATAAAAVPPCCGVLLLQGCGVEEADVRALCTDGLLFAFLQRFREVAYSEMHGPWDSPARQASQSLFFAQLTKVDLSHNPYLGDTGVQQLLRALLCLEATREVSCNVRLPIGSVQHSFYGVEEVLLRDVGCTDAVLTDVVRLLISNIDGVIPGSMEHRSAAHELLDLDTVPEEEVRHALLNEARLLAGIRAEKGNPNTESAEDSCLMPYTYLPSLRLLDLSENSFNSAALIGAVMSGAALRASYAPSRTSDSAVAEHRTQPKHEGLVWRHMGLSAAGGEHGFALGLEECGLSDTVLAQFPLSLELLRAEMSEGEKLLLSPANCTTPVLPRHPVLLSSRRCTWYLGGNHLTHSALLRLRKFTKTMTLCTSVHSQLCSLDAYVERNAILHPATTVEEGEQEDRTAAAVASDAVLWAGITALEDSASSSGITKQAASASDTTFAGRYSALYDLKRLRVSWHQLPSLFNLEAVEETRDPSQFSIALKPLQRCERQTSATPFCTCPHHSGPSSTSGVGSSAHFVAVAPLETWGRHAGAHLFSRSSGEPGPSLIQADRVAAQPVDMMHFHDEDAALWALSSTMTGSTSGFIDAFIAEAEQVMWERRQCVEQMDHQVMSAELLSYLPSPTPSHSDGSRM
ncbi:hypothetical protein LBRM_28_1260 [Leishmania braziliensis MHOM/BR/75/M2904]|uniref:Leucine-rich repeat protein n=1 Tax=Leishmania braziliensis TaxID=5660 RepID=A4HGG3_LEIBR|nr:hypothetical protein LBRM_28_1260 [Leishmania braziliensis MHOM/BR/75/M2904]CAJ2475807.1 unnamed protein product [Leishmania braziliensis]CAM39656.1 hypothetical protein LBRM_28_1260 [Leishmania braziliensis MHOM/BR/75/M2904]